MSPALQQKHGDEEIYFKFNEANNILTPKTQKSTFSSPRLLRKPQSFCAASVISKPNLTAKKGRDCGHTDATSTLCFDASHF